MFHKSHPASYLNLAYSRVKLFFKLLVIFFYFLIIKRISENQLKWNSEVFLYLCVCLSVQNSRL